MAARRGESGSGGTTAAAAAAMLGAWLLATPPAGAADAAAVVETQPFAAVAIHLQRDAPAAVRSLNEASLAAEIQAAIVEIPVRPGETIARGAVVVRLDRRDYELALRRAEAALAATQAKLHLADAQLARGRQLAERGFISAEALTQRETEAVVLRAELRVEEAQVESARRDLAKTVLHAPFRAIVIERKAAVGDLARPGTAILTLLDVDHVELAATVQVGSVDALRAAAAIAFVSQDERYPVRLDRISPAVDPDSRTVEARLVFTGRRPAIGTSGRIEWTDPRSFVHAGAGGAARRSSWRVHPRRRHGEVRSIGRRRGRASSPGPAPRFDADRHPRPPRAAGR